MDIHTEHNSIETDSRENLSTTSSTLPERVPCVGELVQLRSRRWLVEEVVANGAASPLVRLACADDDAQGQSLEVYWDYEIDRRILEEEGWADLAARGFDSPRQFAAFLHTLRWNCVTATDPNLFQSPFRAGIKIDAYQMEPLRKALRLPRVNLFIADDTGLGKTIEAGLIARELLLRRKAKTIVVSAPPSVLEQWRSELEERFGLVFEILDRHYSSWRTLGRFDDIKAVIQVHRLREVLALVGFTRFEAVMPDIHGEYETDVERAQIALEPSWFPAVENRGEGVFLQLCADAIRTWRKRSSVQDRIGALAEGHQQWAQQRDSQRQFPDGPYVLLHTLSHLLLQSLAMRCGYPATSIRERVYVDDEAEHYGLPLYTASPDAEGTLGGLVQQAQYIEDHLAQALRIGTLCSNDPVCAQHTPGQSMEERWLHGAACHGCALIAETSCEMRNDYLDRALVVPVLGVEDAAFFDSVI